MNLPTLVEPDAIWKDDLFGREDEARLLIGYVESITRRGALDPDAGSFTISVDAGYGEGKTFFLRRLAKQFRINHPVAFIDAWADDLSNEPLIALAATLQKSLEPLMADPKIQERFANVLSKTGKIAKILSLGLIRRAASVAVTGTAVAAAEEVFSELSDTLVASAGGELEGLGSDLVSGAVSALVDKGSDISRRISEFHQGRQAITELRESLRQLILALPETGLISPVVIIIDELDRCRPTYAIKLLEEIKHLYDVRGIVFILGLNSEQLAHSVRGAYGSGFNGRSYLRRFVNRTYRLAEPELEPLVTKLCERVGLFSSNLNYPQVRIGSSSMRTVRVDVLIALYLRMYKIRARDVYHVIDILQTCLALSQGKTLYLPYLIPLIVAHVSSENIEDIIKVQPASPWHFGVSSDPFGRELRDELPSTIAQEFHRIRNYDAYSIRNLFNKKETSYAERAVIENFDHNNYKQPIWAVQNYEQLLTSVSRFSDPPAV